MYVSVMQDRLAQQQKAMAEERAYLKEIISRMDTQLNEQQRQLEKVGVKIKMTCFLDSSICFDIAVQHTCIHTNT